MFIKFERTHEGPSYTSGWGEALLNDVVKFATVIGDRTVEKLLRFVALFAFATNLHLCNDPLLSPHALINVVRLPTR